jgi:hypothetical protein
MTAQQWLWGADGAALALVLVAGLAETRRGKRRTLDAPGWVPWRGLQVAGFFGMLAFTIFALKA